MTTTTTTPLRTAKQDHNFLSLNYDSVVWFAGTDREVEHNESIPLSLLPDDPKNWDAILKCSNRHNTHLRGLNVAQGMENALDINNRSSHCSFEGDWGVTGVKGDQVITVKGGSNNISVMGNISSRGNRADLVTGLWSDQSFETSHHIDYSHLYHTNGRPLTFIFCRVNSPIMAALGRPRDIQLPPGAKVLFWKSIGSQIHWWCKFAAVKLGIIKGRKL